MIDLILMTATVRFDNLIRILDFIKEKQEKFKENVKIFWLICKDSYNGTGKIEKIQEKLIESNIEWTIYDSGKEGQANYGGDMYNMPLKDILAKKYKNKDPWVYILDDDNILCDKMFYNLIQIYNTSGKRIIWMHYLRTCGDLVRALPSECFGTYDTGAFWAYRYNPDPSAILFKASIFNDYGGFLGGGDYDFTSCRKMCETYVNEVFFDDYYDLSYTTYHNGLKTRQDIENIIGKSKQYNMTSYIHIQIDDNYGDVFNLGTEANPYNSRSIAIPVLSQVALKKIIKIINEDYGDANN